MNYSVIWVHSAREDLAEVWLAASSADRKRITHASYRLEQSLQSDPEDAGESREGDFHIAFQAPLAAVYRIDHEARRVTIVQVWRY